MKAIQMKDVSRTLAGKKVLDGINLHVEAGETVWLTGSNGAGKTMLLRAMAGLLRPQEGTIEMMGRRLTAKDPYPDSMGIVIDDAAFWKQMTGAQTLRCLAAIRNQIDVKQIREALVRAGLDPADSRKVGKYSLGMKKRLAIAQAIMESPRLLLLDEPTNALDREGICCFIEIVRAEQKKGTTIVIASHTNEAVEGLCDRTVVMENGRLM